MDDVGKKLRRSVSKARALYLKTERGQRKRIQPLRVRVGRRTADAVLGIRELIDFDPVLDLKACLQLQCPTPPTETAAQRQRRPGTTLTGRLPARSTPPAKAAPASRRGAGAIEKAPDTARTTPSPRVDSTSRPPVRHRPAGSGTQPRGNEPDRPRTTRRTRPGDAGSYRDTPPVPGSEPPGDTATGPENPAATPSAQSRGPGPSLVSRRRAWSRSQSRRHSDMAEQEPKGGAADGPAEKQKSATTGARITPPPGARPADVGSRNLPPADGDRNGRQTQAAASRPAGRNQENRPAPASAHRSVAVEETDTQTSVPPVDAGNSQCAAGHGADTPERGDSDLARELAETLYLHGIDRT